MMGAIMHTTIWKGEIYMTVKDLLTMEIDIDVADDVCEELYIAFCGPMKLTDAGLEKFREVLGYKITLHSSRADYILAVIHVDDDNDRVWKKRLRKAIEFFYSAAGYCDCDDYDKWFREV